MWFLSGMRYSLFHSHTKQTFKDSGGDRWSHYSDPSIPKIYTVPPTSLQIWEKTKRIESCIPDPSGSAEQATMLPAVGNGMHWELELKKEALELLNLS